MIRTILRRLIIPQGDTGTFTIPTHGDVSQGDVAIFSIYDPLTQSTVLEKKITATENTLTFMFVPSDTINIEPSNRYQWDVTILRNPLYNENDELVHADSIDSYYAAFKLPMCEIKRVTRNVSK